MSVKYTFQKKAQNPQESSLADKALGIGEAVGQGVLANYSDEINSKISSMLFGGDRDFYLNQQRQREEQFADENPISSFAGNVAGAVASPINFIPGLGVAKNFKNLSMLGKGLNLAKSGGLQGLLSGFGAGEDGIENRAVSAAKGGALGALLSPALGAASGQFAKVIPDKLISPEFASLSSQDKSVAKIFSRFDDSNWGDVLRNKEQASESGFNLTLGEAAGKSSPLNLAEKVIKESPSGAQASSEFLKKRASDLATGINQIADEFGGVASGKVLDKSYVDKFSKETIAKYKPQYQEVLQGEATPMKLDISEIDFDNPFLKRQSSLLATSKEYKDVPMESLKRNPKFLHDLKVELSKVGEPASLGSGADINSKVLGEVKDSIESTLNTQVPGYEQLTKEYGEQINKKKLLESIAVTGNEDLVKGVNAALQNISKTPGIKEDLAKSFGEKGENVYKLYEAAEKFAVKNKKLPGAGRFASDKEYQKSADDLLNSIASSKIISNAAVGYTRTSLQGFLNMILPNRDATKTLLKKIDPKVTSKILFDTDEGVRILNNAKSFQEFSDMLQSAEENFIRAGVSGFSKAIPNVTPEVKTEESKRKNFSTKGIKL